MDGAFELGKRMAEKRSDLAWAMISGPAPMRLFPASGDDSENPSQFMRLVQEKLEEKVIEGYGEKQE